MNLVSFKARICEENAIASNSFALLNGMIAFWGKALASFCATYLNLHNFSCAYSYCSLDTVSLRAKWQAWEKAPVTLPHRVGITTTMVLLLKKKYEGTMKLFGM